VFARRQVAMMGSCVGGGRRGYKELRQHTGGAVVDYDIPDWVHSQHPQKRLPEAWIGQQVVIHRPSGKELWVVLRDVREFGVVYTMIGIPQAIFSPWSSIVWMRPVGEDTQAFEMPDPD
jgi:hypothetical protein